MPIMTMPGNFNFTSIIDVVEDKPLYMLIRAKERESWHKIWLYGFLITQASVVILGVLVVKLSRNKNPKNIPPPPKVDTPP